ncbi:MAG: DUF58 domain-containing protein [Lachnospiraceae bacterium]|nr:DUF58 domain-containing protein [Lachnospiraceae bacterium]
MQRTNYPYRITYALMILFFLFGTIFYRQSFLAILLLLLIILPVISIALAHHAFERIDFLLSAPATTVSMPEKPIIILTAKNPTFFPFLNCELSFQFQNMYFPSGLKNIIALPLEAHKTLTLRFPFDVSQPGMLLFSLEDVKLTDFLHFYTFHKNLNKGLQIPVLPKEKPISFVPATAHTESEDSEFYDPAGALSTDIREVREYIPGDRMQDIHWKLSARMDDLLVKQYERSLDDSLLFLPELYKEEIADTLQTLYAVSIKLIRQKEVFRIAIFHTDVMGFVQAVIHDPEDLLQAFLALYYQKPYDTPDLARSTYQTIFPLYGAFYQIHGSAIDLTEST